jgi:DNA-binding CsgD family transcriptional regulator
MGAILEREGTLGSIERLLADVRVGQGGSLFIVGDPGLGKTTMLDEARRLAAHDFRIGRGLGDAAEAALPFGIIDQALRQLGFGSALEPVRGMVSGLDARAIRFYAIMRFLEEPADKPALMLLDDLHWADEDSLALLTFLCRRIGGLSVGVVAALRAWPRGALDIAMRLTNSDDGELERIAPLSDQAAATLLAGQAGNVSADSVSGAMRLCAGNPLLLEQVAVELHRGRNLPDPGDVVIEKAAQHDARLVLLSRFAGMTASELRFAQAASVFGSRFRPSLAATVAGLAPVDADRALEALAETGLLTSLPGGFARFLHPLVSQVLYDEIPELLRARYHSLAFAVLAKYGSDDGEAAEHALQADIVDDPQAVTILYRAGHAALGAGAVLRARQLLQRAADLAGARASAELLLELGSTLLATGVGEHAAIVFRRVTQLADAAASVRITARRMLGRALHSTGHAGEARAELQAATDLALTSDHAQAVEALLEQIFIAYSTGGPALAWPFAQRARILAAGEPPSLRMRADTAWAFCAFVRGDPEGIPVIEAAARVALADPLGDNADYAWSWGTLGTYANMAKWSERFEDAARAYQVAMRTAERLGSPIAIAQLALINADTCLRTGRLHEAVEMADRATALVELAPERAFWAAIGHGYALAEMGDMDECQAWCLEAEALATADPAWVGNVWLWHLQAVLAMHARATADACALFERIETLSGQLEIREPCVVPWARDAITAYLHGGRLADALRVIESLESQVRGLPCRIPRIVIAGSRAAIAQATGDREAAGQFLRAAVEEARALPMPVMRARVLHQYGAFLRRGGELRQARPFLVEAIDLADTAGAKSLAIKASSELAAAGGKKVARRENPDALTVQETRVAALAGQGLSNQQIARQLFVSVDTVETHLQHIYRKLDIASRRELIRRHAQGMSPSAPAGAGGHRAMPGT